MTLYNNTPATFEELLAPLPDEVQKPAYLHGNCIREVLAKAVENLDAIVKQLTASGIDVQLDPKRYPNGRFVYPKRSG